MVILGGMGSIPGSIIGALLLVSIPEILRSVQEYRMVLYGIVLVFMMLVRPQGLFGKMTVIENVLVGLHSRCKSNTFDAVPKTKKHKIEEKENADKALEILEMVDLKDKSEELSKNSPYGEQRKLEIARALASNPEILLLDEPSLGLAPIIVQNIFELIKQINKMGTTILLVEQNARMALMIADRGYVLETGKIVLSDTAENLLNSDMVRQAYLGEATC